VFGWIEAQAGTAKTKLLGRSKVEAAFTVAVAADSLFRLLEPLALAPG